MACPQNVVPITPSRDEWMGMEGIFSSNEEALMKRLIRFLKQLDCVRVYRYSEFTSPLVGEMNERLKEMKYPWVIRPEREGISWTEQCLVLVHRENDIRCSTTC